MNRPVLSLLLIVLLFSCSKIPKACFSTEESEAIVDQEMRFFSCSKGADAYDWDFGDGQGSAEESPVHIFKDTGNFMVSLSVYNSENQDFDMDRKTLHCGLNTEPENLALGQPASCSKKVDNSKPEDAVDGNNDTGWVATAPPQWISIDLEYKYTINQVRLLVNQSPNGYTEHEVRFMSAGKIKHTLEVKGVTSKWQWIDVTLQTPVSDIDEIRVVSLVSPSWVAWNEIEVYGVGSK